MGIVKSLLFLTKWINLQGEFEPADDKSTHVWVSTFGGEFKYLGRVSNRVAAAYRKSFELRDHHEALRPPG